MNCATLRVALAAFAVAWTSACIPDTEALQRGRGDGALDATIDLDSGPVGPDVGPTCRFECDNGRYCDGREICDPSRATADEFGCVAGDPPCARRGRVCDEFRSMCIECPDMDGDGAYGPPCDDDCDDGDPERFLGNVEVCDAEHRDEDCDCSTVGDLDADGDGFASDECCNCVGTPHETCGPDCDDSDPNTYPGAPDTPGDGIDSNCNGMDG